MESNTETPWIELAHARLRQVEKEDRARFEAFGISPTDLVRACVSRLLSRFRGAGQTPTRDAFKLALGNVNLVDLGLALAWERGDERAWTLYATEYRRSVISAALRQGAGAGSAEELADELPGSLLAAGAEGLASPLARYDGTGSLRAWLCTIVRRRVLDSAKRTSKNEELPGECLASEQVSPAQSAEQHELEQRMHAAGRDLRDSMSTRERLAFLLKYDSELPQRRIAALMGVGDSRVTRLLQQAYAKVRERLERELGDDLGRELLPPSELLLALGSAAPHDTATPPPLDDSQEEPTS